MTGQAPAPKKRPLRIAFCFAVLRSSDSADASFLQQRLISTGLQARGHRLSFLSLTDNLANVIFTEDPQDPRLAPRTWSRAGWFIFARKVFWRLQKLFGIPYLNFFSNLSLYDACLRALPGHDVVHERNGLYRMGVAMACRRLKIPYVFFFDADDVLEHDLFGKPLQGILRWRAKQALQYNLETAARVICVSDQAKSWLEATWKVPAAKIAVLPNAVDVDLFHPDDEWKSATRKALDIGRNPLIVFVGSFFPYQDLEVLLKAFADLLKDFPSMRLLLVGKGGQYQQAVDCAESLGIARSVIFQGFVPHHEISRFLAAADIAVAPYHSFEKGKFLGSSMKLIEYMAAGLATIASDIGQLGEVIRDGSNGLLVPPDDAQAFSTALRKLLENDEMRAQLGRQARKDVLEKYSWENYLNRVEENYMTAISISSQDKPLEA